MCNMEIDGFREGVKHVRQNHPDTLFEDKACPCVICPKRFARMDHLKNHVYSHVNRIRPGRDFFKDTADRLCSNTYVPLALI